MLEARSYIDQNALALAQQTYDRALTVDPKNTDAMLGKARLYVASHQINDAIAEYEKVLPLLTDDDEGAALVSEEAQGVRRRKDADPGRGARTAARSPTTRNRWSGHMQSTATTMRRPEPSVRPKRSGRMALGTEPRQSRGAAAARRLYRPSQQRQPRGDRHYQRVAELAPERSERARAARAGLQHDPSVRQGARRVSPLVRARAYAAGARRARRLPTTSCTTTASARRSSTRSTRARPTSSSRIPPLLLRDGRVLHRRPIRSEGEGRLSRTSSRS